jgi:type IV secretory pathway TrbL component
MTEEFKRIEYLFVFINITRILGYILILVICAGYVAFIFFGVVRY